MKIHQFGKGESLGEIGYFDGTHRIVDPAETVRSMRRFMPAMGITRIANITGLDRIGIPVTSVIRPNSRSVAVSQGKGVSLAAAQASGLMEAIETYHAENISLPVKYASYEDLRYSHDLADIEGLPKLNGSRFHPFLRILWIEGWNLLSDTPCWLPFELVHTDYADPMPPGSGCFFASSNGLASGNHILESISHGICEVVERDATALWHQLDDRSRAERRIRPDSITGPHCRWLMDRFAAASVSVAIWETTTDIGIPCFYCWIAEHGKANCLLDRPTVGAGCHPEPGIALSRALTEAAQDRLTLIAGSRDDLDRADYDEMGLEEVFDAAPERDFPAGCVCPSRTIQSGVEWQLARLRAAGLDQVVFVDLTKTDLFNVPVVRVVIPGLEGLADDPDYVPGGRALRVAGAAR